MIFLLSTFIAVSKRRDDLIHFKEDKIINRRVITKYSIEFIDNSISIISSVLIVSYLMFITSNQTFVQYESSYIYFTFLFVIMGILRFNQLTYVYKYSGSPVKLLFKDTYIQIILIGWVLTFFLIIYLKI